MAPLLSSLFLSILFPISAFSQRCFWPNGTKTSSVYKPCANSGSCCYYIDEDHHDLCYSNGFCQSLFWGYLYRGGCTSHNWDSTLGCASDCLEAALGDVAIVTPCNNFSCCTAIGRNGSCCNSNSNTVAWNNATFLPHTTTTTTAIPTSTIQPPMSSPSSTSLPICPMTTNKAPLFLSAGLGIPLALSLTTIAILSWMLFRRPSKAAIFHKVPARPIFVQGPFEKPVFGSEILELSVEKQPELGGKSISELGTGSVFQGRIGGG